VLVNRGPVLCLVEARGRKGGRFPSSTSSYSILFSKAEVASEG
jgi:hypothetical protein